MSALDIYIIAGNAYFAVLVGMALWMMARADKPMLAVALLLLCNFAANQAFTGRTGLVSPWWFRLGVDAVSAFILTIRPSGWVQSRVAEFFIAMVVVSAVLGIGDMAGRINLGDALLAWRYDITLSAVGVAQLTYFVVSGGIYGGGKRAFDWRLHSGAGRLAVASRATRERRRT